MVALAVLIAACGAGDTPGGLSGNVTADGPEPGTAPAGSRECDVPIETVLGTMNDATFAVFGEARPPGPDGGPGPIYLLVGTAWAVRDQVLATNAHVTEAFRVFADQGVQLTDALAVQSRTGSVGAPPLGAGRRTLPRSY